MSGRALLTLEEARAHILDGVDPLPPEEIGLPDALGRVLAEDAESRLMLPPWDNSAMDGYAVRSEDITGASPDAPVTLEVRGEVAAGHTATVTVMPGTAVRVLTGGIVPEGADTIVKVEDTDAQMGVAALPDSVAVRAAVAPATHIRLAGSDAEEGQALLGSGTRLSPAAIAVLAATGHARVAVFRRPLVAIVSTGDELVPIGQPLGPASIADSNSESVAAQATAAGADVIRLGIASDDHADVRSRLQRGIEVADVLVTTGGVSVGAHDVVKDVFEELGALALWRVAIQPGKPLAFGRTDRPGGGTCLLFGLPGNPVSSFVTFELFTRPLLRRLRGERELTGRLTVRAVLADAVRSSRDRRAFIRVRLEPDAEAPGRYRAHTAGRQGSHVLSALAIADGLAIIPEGVGEAPVGTEVEVIRLDVEVT
jgi:molybdopterin molybdotransferase